MAKLARGAVFFVIIILYQLFIRTDLFEFLGVRNRSLISVKLNETRTVPYLIPLPMRQFRSPYYYAPVGQKLLVCNVSLLYDGKDRGIIKCRQSHFVMQDSKGEYYQSADISERWTKEAQLLNVELSHQGRMRGDVVFVVPQSVVAEKVEYREPKQEAAPLIQF